jgi:hypothetical protein
MYEKEIEASWKIDLRKIIEEEISEDTSEFDPDYFEAKLYDKNNSSIDYCCEKCNNCTNSLFFITQERTLVLCEKCADKIKK